MSAFEGSSAWWAERARKAEGEVVRLRTALETIASARGPLIEADPACLGHGYEQIAKDALNELD